MTSDKNAVLLEGLFLIVDAKVKSGEDLCFINVVL